MTITPLHFPSRASRQYSGEVNPPPPPSLCHITSVGTISRSFEKPSPLYRLPSVFSPFRSDSYTDHQSNTPLTNPFLPLRHPPPASRPFHRRSVSFQTALDHSFREISIHVFPTPIPFLNASNKYVNRRVITKISHRLKNYSSLPRPPYGTY